MTTTLRTACVDAMKLVLLADSRVEDLVPASPALRAARLHVAACPVCASVLDAGGAENVLSQLGTQRSSAAPIHRAVLGFIASAQCLFALPWLLGFDPLSSLGSRVAASHLTRDGAIGVIVGVAGIATALRPRHAFAMLVVAITSISMQALGFAIDETQNRVDPSFELLHALVPIIVAMIGFVATRRRPPSGHPSRGPSRLRVVP